MLYKKTMDILEEEFSMKKYYAPTVVEFGNATELVKGCGGWGCEVGLDNFSYCMDGGYCHDCIAGESGDC